jgi:hypothetical protein
MEPASSGVTAGSGRRRPVAAVELLIGGKGGPAPERHWLRVASSGQNRGEE